MIKIKGTYNRVQVISNNSISTKKPVNYQDYYENGNDYQQLTGG
jgi:hypothetical protein